VPPMVATGQTSRMLQYWSVKWVVDELMRCRHLELGARRKKLLLDDDEVQGQISAAPSRSTDFRCCRCQVESRSVFVLDLSPFLWMNLAVDGVARAQNLALMSTKNLHVGVGTVFLKKPLGVEYGIHHVC